jgi:hypothetical protein
MQHPCLQNKVVWFGLFICVESHEQVFSYMATVTITGDEAANLMLELTTSRLLSKSTTTKVKSNTKGSAVHIPVIEHTGTISQLYACTKK